MNIGIVPACVQESFNYAPQQSVRIATRKKPHEENTKLALENTYKIGEC